MCIFFLPIIAYGLIAAVNLDCYTDVQDLSYSQYRLDQDPHPAKYRFDL